MIHNNPRLRYVVIQHHKMEITPRARFADKDEAEWYAMNVWKAARLKGWFTIFRVLDTQEKVETTVCGSIAPLADNDITAACVLYGR